MTDPAAPHSSATPTQPAYVDPVTGQPVYLDPATGQYMYGPGAPVGSQPPYYMVNYGYGAVAKTNGMAIAALSVAIAGSVLCGIFGGAIGAILGHVARRQIARSGERGAGLALAAIIVGWTVTAIALIVLGVFVVPSLLRNN
jgi:hypothetical protein